MKNWQRQLLGVLGCICIIAAAFLLLTFARRNEVTSILLFGRALDAMVTAGVLGNATVFVLATATRLNSFRTALFTFLVVSVVLLVVATLIGGSVDPQFRFGPLLAGYAISFAFWLGVHWLWSRASIASQAV